MCSVKYRNFPILSDLQNVRTPFKIEKIINFLGPKFKNIKNSLKNPGIYVSKLFGTVNMTKNQDYQGDLWTISFVFASVSCDYD